MERENFSKYLYRAENLATELVIVALSLGAIGVGAWILVVSSQEPTIIEFGNQIAPWITMLALMIIGRELWLINRKISHYLEQQGE